jgi:hypothetical protein
MARQQYTDVRRNDDALEAQRASRSSRFVCAACDVLRAAQRRMAWMLVIAAGLVVALTVIVIRWVNMG